MVRLATTVDFKNYLKLLFQLTFRRPLAIFLYIIVIYGQIRNTIFYFNGDIEKFPVSSLIFCTAAIILHMVRIYWEAQSTYNAIGQFRETNIYFSSENITIKGRVSVCELDWNDIYKILELKKWILLYQDKHSFIMVSKEDIDSTELETLRKIIKNTGIKAKLRKD